MQQFLLTSECPYAIKIHLESSCVIAGERERGLHATVVPAQFQTTCPNRPRHWGNANTPTVNQTAHTQHIERASTVNMHICTHIHDNPSLPCVSKHRAEMEMENMSLRVQRVKKISCKLLIHQDTVIFRSGVPKSFWLFDPSDPSSHVMDLLWTCEQFNQRMIFPYHTVGFE